MAPFPMHEMEALANAKRITYASRPRNPQAWKKPSPTKIAPNTEFITDATATVRTHMKMFLLSTGDDSGNEAEIQGFIKFLVPFAPTADAITVNLDFPIISAWTAENGGLGHLLLDHFHDSANGPTTCQAFLFEDDSPWGADMIANVPVNFNDPASARFTDGGEWVWKCWNVEDNRYVAHVWLQVTQV
ncbi:uncharacterized protein FTOL_05233 [Fusarium torulosum]|uniref:Uncharacterized protein n=1 Tax=Fusarium torulosum TaxID=33205 RepID=A0AAE8M759_9HYPO|nr:uncharacterized protein FTOL_05233 [Fusarium torulosum]